MSNEQAVTTDPRVLPRERCVTRYLLDDLAQTQPQKEFAVFQDGESWSYEAVRNKVRALATGAAKAEPGFFAGNVEMWRALKRAALAARKTTKVRVMVRVRG